MAGDLLCHFDFWHERLNGDILLKNFVHAQKKHITMAGDRQTKGIRSNILAGSLNRFLAGSKPVLEVFDSE